MIRNSSILFIVFCLVFSFAADQLNAQEPLNDNLTYSLSRSQYRKSRNKPKRDRTTYGFYLFGGMSLSTFVGSEVYDWTDHVDPIPGYTLGGGFDILRKPNGIYFGTELAFTMKGCSRDYQNLPDYGEKASSSRILLNYLQFTPLKIGWTFKVAEKLNIGVYSGWGMDFLLEGVEKDRGYEDVRMRHRGWWNGDFDMFIPLDLNLDFNRNWSLGFSYNLGLKGVVQSDVNADYDKIHNSTAAVKAIYHFQFKDRSARLINGKGKRDKYHREIFY